MNQSNAPDTTLYAGGALLDAEAARVDGHALLVTGDRIARVAPIAEFDGYSGARVDTGGMTLLPGLLDCHVHLCFGAEPDPRAAMDARLPGAVTLLALENAQASLRGGLTGLRDCGGKDYLEFPVRDACNSGRFSGPTIRCAGRMICMTGGHGHRTGRVADGPDEVVRAVREQIHAGSDLVKIMATGGVMTPGVNPEDAHYSAAEMAAGVGEARRFHRPTASHAQGAEGILNAVNAGITSIEHGIYLNQECIELMLKAGIFLVPTFSAVRNILAHADHGIPAFMVEKCRRVVERHQESIRMFRDAGGLIAMGTDAGTPFNRHGDNAMELRYMVDAGLTPAEALRAATGDAARLMGLAGAGAIAQGKNADLLLVDGDPLTDIDRAADRSHHRLVVKGGRVVARNPAPPIPTGPPPA